MDFLNSVANLTLNRVLHQLRGCAKAPEPAWQGHAYYPFPALRIGPAIGDIGACSHLNDRPIALMRARCLGARGRRTARLTPDRAPKWLADDVIVLHPWQLNHSTVVRELIDEGLLVVEPERLLAWPLASQRTFRLEDQSADIKLSVDATLTGERRLLFPINVANATHVSDLARRLIEGGAVPGLDVQDDIVSIDHVVPGIGPHVSAIVRAPLSAPPGETIIAAINLWTGPGLASSIFGLAPGADPHAFIYGYARLLFGAALLPWLRGGLAFEPHLQNTYVRVREGEPVAMVLRDLDGTIMDRDLVTPRARALGLQFHADTWAAMPGADTAEARLLHALHLGHLCIVASELLSKHRAQAALLTASLAQAWRDLEQDCSASERRCLQRLRARRAHVKRMLENRLSRSPGMSFSAPA